MVEKIVDAFNKNKQVVKKSRTSLGYMGHITIMENFLSTLEQENYKTRIQSTAGWNEFTEESKEKHFIECVYRHGGQTPLPKSFVQRREAEDAELLADEQAKQALQQPSENVQKEQKTQQKEEKEIADKVVLSNEASVEALSKDKQILAVEETK